MNDATYSITAAITHATSYVQFQGFTAAYADGGRFILDGGTSGASYILLTLSANRTFLWDFILQNNGATGSAGGLSVTGGSGSLIRSGVVNSVRGQGIINVGLHAFVELETYACNQSNTASFGGIYNNASGGNYIRCISHDNAGSNTRGFLGLFYATYIDCIADTNGGAGFDFATEAIMSGCDSYNNGGSGIELADASGRSYYIENCNLVKNVLYGINGTGTSTKSGAVINCGFGSGTQANGSGTTNALKAIVESGSVTYAADVTPWIDPANGDFRISLVAAKGTGRGTFTETAASYAGTVGYPDRGAAQSRGTGNIGIIGD